MRGGAYWQVDTCTRLVGQFAVASVRLLSANRLIVTGAGEYGKVSLPGDPTTAGGLR